MSVSGNEGGGGGVRISACNDCAGGSGWRGEKGRAGLSDCPIPAGAARSELIAWLAASSSGLGKADDNLGEGQRILPPAKKSARGENAAALFASVKT